MAPLYPELRQPAAHSEDPAVDASTKTILQTQLSVLSSTNAGFKAMLNIPPPMLMAGMPPMPVSLQPALAPYLAAMKGQADNYDKLIKLVSEVIDKS